MKKSIYTAKSAVKDYNKKLLGFNNIINRLRRPEEEMEEMEDPTMTLEAQLASMGRPSNFASKLALANSIGFKGYNGTPEQDRLLMGAIQGKTANEERKSTTEMDNKYKDQEFGLKNKELDLKKEEIAGKKQASPDEIAQSLISNI
jgi:hypothetical protein